MTPSAARRVFLSAVALALAVEPGRDAIAQVMKETVGQLPTPTGAAPVGTTIAYLTDSTRSDADFPRGRPVTLQLWYPASVARGSIASYLPDRGLAESLLRNQYYGVDSAALTAWAALRTHSRLDAPPVAGTHPLVAFSVGLGVIRANYTSIAEELASHGFIVAMVESPLQGLMVLPNGTEVSDTAGRYEAPGAHRDGVTAWARDISFVLDRLQRARVPTAVRRVAATIDWARAGATGHSSGGLVAVAACESDARLRACVNMDGGVASPEKEPLAEFVTRGVTKPTLFLRSEPLYDDTTLARRGMTREQWAKRGEAGRVAFGELVSRSRAGAIVTARVAGTGHFSFSDAPFVMPSAITRFGGRIIQPPRGWTVITSLLRAYFESELRGRGDGLAAVASRFGELTVERP
jgi:dienelactone hydrolase